MPDSGAVGPTAANDQTDIPSGFRMTEIGPLPTHWEIFILADLFDIQQGQSLSPKRRQGRSPRPFLRTANVLWGQIDLSVLDRMDFSDEEAERLALKVGDLLVCEGGEIGRTALWRGEFDGCCYQNHLHRLRARTQYVEPEFYAYWMQAAWLHFGLYAGQGNRTTIPNLSRSRLGNFPVPCPPLEEQRAIARVLRTVQRAKEATEKVIAATRELKKSLLRHLFTYGYCTVQMATAVELAHSDIGAIPASWKVVAVSNVARLESGGTPPKGDASLWSGDLPWASPKDLKRLRLNDTEDHITPAAAEAHSKIVPAATILIVVRGMILAKEIPVCMITRAAAFNQDIKAVLPAPEVNPDFLLHALVWRRHALVSQVGTSAHGTRRLSTSAVADLKIPFPDPVEQRRLVRALNAVEAKLDVELQRCSAIGQLFESLLSGLLTGALRALQDTGFRLKRDGARG